MPEKMFSVAVLSSLVVAVVLGQDDGIRCGECIMEMHRFGGIIHAESHVLADYLADNYCPTIEEEHQESCPGHLAQHYPDMLGAVVHRFISSDEGARHMSRPWGLAIPSRERLPVTSALLAWSGSRRTLRTPFSRRRHFSTSSTTGATHITMENTALRRCSATSSRCT